MKLTNLETLISLDRLANIIKYSHYASRLTGAIAEFGVFKGGSLELLAKLNPDAALFGIDSFAGLPEPTLDKDYHNEGEFSEVDFKAIYGYFKMLYPNVRILKGFTPRVFKFFDNTVHFKFAHIDVDLYQSVMDGLAFFYPRMVQGGVILIDDYKWSSTPGCELAIEEFFSDKSDMSFRQELKYFDTDSSDSHHQYLIVK